MLKENKMESIESYLTVEGWKKDWDQTKEDLGYLFRKKSTDRLGDFINRKGDYSEGFTISGYVEALWGQKVLANYFPQYRYFFVPLYRLCGGNKRPVFSTMVTFTVSELVHDWSLIPNMMEGELTAGNYFSLAFWIGSGLAISYAKRRRQWKKKLQNNEGLEEVLSSNVAFGQNQFYSAKIC